MFPYVYMNFNYKPVLIVIYLPGSGRNFPDFKVPKVLDWGVEVPGLSPEPTETEIKSI